MISAKKTPEKSRYPVHYLVWHNKHRQLEKELATNEQVRDRGAIRDLSPHKHGPVSLLWLMIWACGFTNVIGGIDAPH